MQTTKSTIIIKPITHKSKGLKEKFWQWMGFTNRPTIRLYPGYGHAEHLVIYGHALSFSSLSRKKYSKLFPLNLLALIRLFIVKQKAGVTVQLNWESKLITTTTDTDGFIKLNWQSDTPVAFGWHEVRVNMQNAENAMIAKAYGSVFIPHSTQFAFISDIDDTFLISHSTNLRKRLSVLFTRNARTRKPFDGVVKHYQLLSRAHTKQEEPNPFFYVSSSEWNLFEYISEFMTINGLPKGVLLLSTMKKLNHFLTTGQNSHGTKFTRIVRILEAFPKQKFILLGDSSQQDPVIYNSIVEYFPGRIHAVYIRDIYKKNSQSVQEVLRKLEETGIPCCFFTHSAEAIAHSRRIGLIV